MSPPMLSSSQIPASRKSRLSLSRNHSFSGSSSTGQCRSLSELNDSSLDLNLDDLQSCSTSLNSLQVACENASFLPNEPYSQCRPLSKLNDFSLDLRTDEVDDLRSSLNFPQVAYENASFLPNESYNFDQKETDTCIVSQNLKTLQKKTSPDVHRSRSLLSCSSLASNSTPSGGLKNVKAISNYEESNSAHKVGTSVLKVKQAQRKLKLKNPCLEKKLINKNSEALYMTNSLRYESVEQFKGEPTGNSKQHRASKHKGFTFKRNPSAGVKVSMESSETKWHLEIETLISKKFQPKKEKSVSLSKKQCDHSKPSCSEASEHSSTRTNRVFSSTASSSPGFSSDSFGTSFGTILNPLALKCSAQNLAWRNGTSLSGVKHHKTYSFNKKEKVLKTKGVLNVSRKGEGSKGQSLKKKLAKQYSLPLVTRPVTMPPKWDSTKSSTLPKQASPSSLVSGESQMPNTLSRVGKAVVRGGLDALPNSLNDDRERLTMAVMTPLNAPPDDEACSNTVRPISLAKNPASTFGWNMAENLKNVYSKFPQLQNRLQSSMDSNKRKRVAVAETHSEKRAKYQKTDDLFVESGLPKKGLENVVDNYNGFSIAGKCSQSSSSLKKSCQNLKEKHVEKNASSPQEKKVFLPIQKNKVSNRDKVEISVQPENTNVSTHRSRNIGSNQCEEHLLSDKQKHCAISLESEKNEASVQRTIAGINGQKNIAPFQSRKKYTEIKPEKGNNLIRSQADKDRNYSLISQGNVQSENSVSLIIKEKREICIETEKDVDSMQPSENEARVLIRDESIKMKERRPSFPSRNETSNLHTKTSPRIRRMSDKSSSQSEQKQTSVKSKQKKRKKQKISVEYITDETDSSDERTSSTKAVKSNNFPTPKPSDNSELTTRKTSYLSEPSENSDQPGFNLSRHFGQDSRKNIIRQIGNYTMQGVNATLPLGKRKSFVQPCTNTALKKGSRAVCENILFSAGNTDETIKSSACTSSVRTRVNSDSMELPHSRLGFGVQEKCSREFGESTREVHMKQNLDFNVPPSISRKTYKGKKDHESSKTSTTKNGPSFLLHYINENNQKLARNLSVCEKSVMKKKRSSNAKEVVSSSWFDKLFFPSNKEEFEQLNATTGTLVDLNVTRARKRIVQSWSNEALQLKLSEQRSKQERLKRLKQHLAKAMKILKRNLETFTKILERKAVSFSTPSTCQSYESSVYTRELTASPVTDSTAPKVVCAAPQGGSTALQVDSIPPQTDFTAHPTDFPRVHVDCWTHEIDSTVVQGNASSCYRQTTLHKETFSSQSLSTTSSKQCDSHEVQGNTATGVLNANVPTKAIRAAGSNSLNNQIESCHESIEGMKLDVRASELKTTSTENNTDTNRGEGESGLAPSCKVIEKNEATNNCESLANDRNSVEQKIQSTGKALTNFECDDSTPAMSPCLSLSKIGDTDNHGETSSEKSGTDSENNFQESVADTLNSSQSMIPRITSSPSQTRDEPDTNTTANRFSESRKHFTNNAVVSVQQLDSSNDSKCKFGRSASENLAPRMKQEVMSPYSDVGLIAREIRDSFECGFLNSIVKREIKLETDAPDSQEDLPCPSHCENSFNFDANELNERADVLKSGATNPLTSNTSYATAAPMVIIQTPFKWPKNEYQLPEMGEDSDSDVTVVFEDADEEVGNYNLGISPVSKSTGCPLKKEIKEETSEMTTEVSLVQPTPARDVQGTSDGSVSSNVSEMPKTSQESVSNHDINKFTSSEAIDSPESSENLSVFDSSNFNHSDYVKKDDGILKSLNTHREKQNSNLFAPNSSILENMSNDFVISAVKTLESENDSISCSKENNSSNAYDQSCVQSSEPKSKIVSIFDSDDELPDLNINLSKQSKDILKGSNNPESETNSRIGAGEGFIKTSYVDVNSDECLTIHATVTSANTDCNENSSLLALKSDSGHHVRAESYKAIPVRHGCCSSTDEFESEIPPTASNDENKYSKLSAASIESSSPAPVSSMTSKNRGKRGNCTATAYKPSLRVQNTSAKTNARGKKQRPCTARYKANKIQVRMNLTANNENIQSKEVENGNSGSSNVFSSCLSLTKPASNPKGCALLEPMSSALRSDVSNDDPGFSMPNIPAPFVGEKPQVNTSVTPSSDCSNNHENNTDTNRGESESGLAPSCKVIEKNEATNNCESLANDRNSVEKKIQSTGKAPTNFECEDSTPTMSPCLSLSQIGDTDNHGETSSEKSGTDSENNVQESVTDTLNSSQSMIPRITSSPSQTRDEPDTNTTANRSSESTKHFTDNAVVSVQKLDSTNDSKCMFVRSASEDLAPRMKQEVMSPYSDVGLIAREMRDSFESGFLNSIVKREIKLETDATDSHEDSPCPSHCENSFNFDANELNERADVLKSGATNPLTSNTSYATAAPMVVIQTPFIWPKNEYQLPEMGEDSDSDVTVVFEDAEEEVGNSNLGISPVSKSTGCPLKKGIKEQTSEKTTEVSLVQPTPARDVQGTSDGGVSSNVSEMPKTSQESVSNHDINKFTSSEAIDSPESSENLSVFDSSNFNHSDYVKKDDGILKSLNTHREKQNSNLFAPNSSILENMSNDFGISAVKNLESENDSISCSKENNSSNAYDQSCVQSSEPKSKIVSIFDSDDELPDLNINLSKQSKDISKGSNNPESETNSRIGAGDGFIKTSSVDVNSEECLTSHATITSANTDCNANSSLLALKSDSGHHVRAEPNKAIPVKHGCCSSTDEFESEIPPTAPNDENKYSKLSAASNESSSPAPVSSMTSKNRGKRGNCTATAYKPSLRVQNTSAKTNARGKKQRPCTARYNANKIQVRMNLTANNENIQSKEVENGNSGSSSVFSSCLSLTKPASNPKGCALLEPMSSALRSDVSNDDPGFSMPNIPAPFVGEKPQVNTSVTPSSDCSNNHGTEIKENVNLPDFKHDSSFLQPNKSVFYSNASSYAHNSQASGDNTAQNIQSKHQSFGSHQTLRPPYSSNVSSTQAYMGNPNPLTYSQNSLNKMPNTLISQLQPGVYMSNVPNIGYQIIPSKTDQNLVTPLQSPSILLRNPFISLQTSCVIPQTSFVIPQTSSALLQNPGGVHISPATVILNATSLLSNPTPMHNNSAAIVENQPNTFGNPKVTLENLVVSLPNSHAKLQSPAATLQSPLATHSSKLHGISSRSNELEMRWIQNHLMNTSRNWTSRALCNTIDVSQAKEDPCPRAISDTNLPKSVAELCSSSGSLISNQGSAIKIQVVPPLHNPSSVANVPQSESINKAETPGPAVKNGSRERPVLSVNNMSVTQGMSSLKRVLTDKMPLNMNKKEHDELFKQPKKKKVYSKVQAASESNKVSLQESYCGNGENSVLNASESAPKLPRELQSHSQLESTMCHVPSNGGDSNSNIVSKVGHPFMDSSKQNLSQKQFLAQMALETNMPAFDSSYVQEKLPVNVETSISTSLVTNSSWKPTCISDQILFNRNDQKTQESLNAFIESPSMVEISDDGNKKFNTDSIDAEPMITDDQDALQYGNNSSNGATHRAVCDLVSNETCNLKTSHIETSSGPHKNVESVKQSTPATVIVSPVVTDSTKSPITSATVAPNVRTSQTASNTSHRTVVILNVSEKDDMLHNTSRDGTSNINLPASTNSVVLLSVISSNLSVQKGDKDATESKLQNMPIEFHKTSGSTSGLQNPSSFPRQKLLNSDPMVQEACNAAMRFPCWRSSTTLFPSKLVDQSSSLRLPRGHNSSSFLSHRGQPLILPPRAQAQHILQPQISVHSRMQVPASVIPPQTKASLTVRPLQMDAFTSSQTPQLRTGGIAQQSQTYPLLRPVQTSPRPFHTQPGLFVRPVAPHMPQSAAQSPFFMGQNLPPNATNPSSRPLGSSYGLNLPLRSLLPSSDGKSVVTSVSCTQSSFPAQLRSVGTTTIYAEGSLCPNHVDGQPARDSRNPTLPSNSSNWPAASHAGAERHHIESQLKKENNHLQSNLKQRERGGNQNTDSFHSSNSIFRSAAPMQLASQPGTSRSEHIPSIQGVSVSSTEGSLARCAVCGKTNEEMARCCVVSYCSLNCQVIIYPPCSKRCVHDGTGNSFNFMSLKILSLNSTGLFTLCVVSTRACCSTGRRSSTWRAGHRPTWHNHETSTSDTTTRRLRVTTTRLLRVTQPRDSCEQARIEDKEVVLPHPVLAVNKLACLPADSPVCLQARLSVYRLACLPADSPVCPQTRLSVSR
ncbi:hypothetical protein FHG87_017359 [Trinorchestia longiramus]|nr:hypothetical protein FHG87_017359 [Trinorchestia longiramus]